MRMLQNTSPNLLEDQDIEQLLKFAQRNKRDRQPVDVKTKDGDTTLSVGGEKGIVSGKAETVIGPDGRMKEVTVGAGASSGGLGVEVGGTYKPDTNDVKVKAETNVGKGSWALEVDTENQTGSLNADVNGKYAGATFGIKGSRDAGLEVATGAHIAGFRAEHTYRKEGNIPNTWEDTLTLSAGPENVFQTTTKIDRVLTKEGHPLHDPEKVTALESMTTSTVTVMGEVQSYEVKTSTLQANGKYKTEVVEKEVTPEYEAFRDGVTDGLDAVGPGTAFSRGIRDNMVDRLIERTRAFGEGAPNKSRIASDAQTMAQKFRSQLSDPATVQAIEEGIFNRYETHDEKNAQKGNTAPPRNDLAALKASVEAEIAKIPDQATIEEHAQTVLNQRAMQVQQEEAAAAPHDAPTQNSNEQAPLTKADKSAVLSGLLKGAPSQEVTIKAGDTLSQIAQSHGTTVDALMKANPQIKDADKIYAGNRVNVPGSVAPSPRTATQLPKASTDLSLDLNALSVNGKNAVDAAYEKADALFEGTSLGSYRNPQKEAELAQGIEDMQNAVRAKSPLSGKSTPKGSVSAAMDAVLGNADNYDAYLESARQALAPMSHALGVFGDVARATPGPVGAIARTASTVGEAAGQALGAMLDRDTVDALMKSKAYAKDPAVTGAVRGHFATTYGDNNPAAPKREDASQNPDLAAKVAQAQKEALQQVKQDNAVSAAQAEADTTQESALTTTGFGKEEPGTNTPARSKPAARRSSWAKKSLAEQHKAIRNETERRSAANAGAQGRESLYGKDSMVGSMGTAGYTDERGRYHSGTGRSGNPTGGSRVDKYGREIGAYGQFTRDIMFRGDGSASAGNTRVICTELVRQGRMAPSLQRLDIAFTLKHLSPTTVRGYHFWAVPYVRLMRRSKLATAIMDPIATWRALEIAHQMGEREKPHPRGKVVRWVMEPMCWLVGRVIEILPGDPGRFHPYFRTNHKT